MKNRQTDVLIVGSGLAGIRAAIEARRAGAAVLVVSRSAVGKASNSAIAKGNFAIPGTGSPEDSPEQHLADIMAGSGGIGDPGLVSVMVRNLEVELDLLTECGAPLNLRSDGSFAVLRSPGHSFPRLLGTRRGSGVELLAPLVARAREMGVGMEQGVEILSLLDNGEGACGAWGVNQRGDPVVIQAGAVVLATGGLGSLYPETNNAPGTFGLGQAMALNKGLSLVDMEFIQFYPTYLRMPGKPRVMVYYETLVAFAGATLRNRRGEDIRELYGLTDGASLTRDRLSRAIASEINAGRGVGADGGAVVMDLSTMKKPEKYRRALPRAVPPDVSEIHVAPVAHFSMGGVAVKPGGETGMPGLWAVGEVAGGIHGANRIGGNALAECLALGRVAGSAAAKHSMRREQLKPLRYQPGLKPASDAGGHNLPAPGERLKLTMGRHAAVLRDAGGLEQALAEIDELKGILEKGPAHRSVAGLRLSMMLDVAHAVCLSALKRRESRGSHFRTDHPRERGEYRGNFLVKKAEGRLAIKFMPRK